MLVSHRGLRRGGKACRAAGVDVVVAQGLEAGGHVWGRVASLALVPAVVDAVAPDPVIAAGGIGDATRGRRDPRARSRGGLGRHTFPAGRGGNDPRALPSPPDRGPGDRPLCSQISSTAAGRAPHRALRNTTSMPGTRPDGRPRALGPARDKSRAEVGRLADRRYTSGTPSRASRRHRRDSLWAGQSVALATRIQPAAEIVRELTSRL